MRTPLHLHHNLPDGQQIRLDLYQAGILCYLPGQQAYLMLHLLEGIEELPGSPYIVLRESNLLAEPHILIVSYSRILLQFAD